MSRATNIKTASLVSRVLKSRHRKECAAVAAVKRGDWETCWAMPHATHIRQTRRTIYVLLWRCNDPLCPGELIMPMKEVCAVLKP